MTLYNRGRCTWIDAPPGAASAQHLDVALATGEDNSDRAPGVEETSLTVLAIQRSFARTLFDRHVVHFSDPSLDPACAYSCEK